MLLPMGLDALFCCQQLNVSFDDTLHSSAADIVKHCC